MNAAERERGDHAATIGLDVPRAIAAHARGALLLARGDAAARLGPLRRALDVWQEIAAPYESARAGVLVAPACRAFGESSVRSARKALARISPFR